MWNNKNALGISEDVDFKVFKKQLTLTSSKEGLRRELKKYHNLVLDALERVGFVVSEAPVK